MVTPLRVVDVLTAIPAGCITFRDASDANAPHIRQGEAVIVDPHDLTPAHGELFLVEWSSRHRAIMLARQTRAEIIRDDEPVWADVWWLRRIGHGRMHLSDGPMHERGIERVILGRVVGVYDPAVSRLPLAVPAALQRFVSNGGAA